jgi:hypothetical protein
MKATVARAAGRVPRKCDVHHAAVAVVLRFRLTKKRSSSTNAHGTAEMLRDQ